MKIYIQQQGESPKVISDTFAELPVLANPGPTSVEFRTNFESVAPGTVAFVKEFQMEMLFDGSAWSTYTGEITQLSATAKPATAPNGARLRTVDNGTLFIAFNNVWYPQP